MDGEQLKPTEAEPGPAPAPSPEQFVALYTRYQQPLYRYVATLLPRPFDVDDVLQEASRVMWQKFASYDPAQPFLPWAYGVAYYEVLRFWQREQTRRKHFSPAVMEALSATRVENADLLDAQSRALKTCLEKLPTRERQLIEQRYGSDESLVDLASRLRQSSNSLYKALQRVREKLLRCAQRALSAEGWEQ